MISFGITCAKQMKQQNIAVIQVLLTSVLHLESIVPVPRVDLWIISGCLWNL